MATELEPRRVPEHPDPDLPPLVEAGARPASPHYRRRAAGAWLALWALALVILALRAGRRMRVFWSVRGPQARRALISAGRWARRAAVATSGWLRRQWPTLRAVAATAAAVAAVAAVALWRAAATPIARLGQRRSRPGPLAPTLRTGSSLAALALRWSSTGAAVTVSGGTYGLRRGAAGAGWVAGRARRGATRAGWLVTQVRRPARDGGRSLAGRIGVALLALATLLVAGVGGITVALVTGSYLAVGAINATAHLRPGTVNLPSLAQRSVIYAADGSVVAVLHGDTNRVSVPLAQMSPNVVRAVVDTEDAGFWTHGAVDARAVVRALTTDLTAGKVRQGGSTLTEQLVKNTVYDPGHSFVGKAKEMLLADRLEAKLGRPEVLERYLNTVYFGEGAYGVEAAAESFFGTSAARLDPARSALLAGMIQDPSGYDPIRHPSAAAARRATVLGLMVSHRHLSPAQEAAAERQPLPTHVTLPPSVRDYFSAAVRNELLADPRLGRTYQDRYRAVFEGGLRIRTTLDPSLQRDAEAAVAAGIPAGYHLTAALAAVDPSTGDVRAVVGGPDFGSSQYDAALAGAGRQPGSAFKVFTLVTALEQGHSISDVIDGSTPCTIPNPGGTPNPWTPANYEGEAFGPITLAEATAKSVNCAYARLALKVGLGSVAATAHAMGVTSHLAVVPSMTLGTNVVTPLQMASAYATLAADGVHHRPHLVQEVDGSDGRVLIPPSDSSGRVMSPQVAREATQALEQVVQSGTGTAAALPGRQVAGKTGTAESYQDAWFVGYTPQLATAVWMGDPSGEVPMRNVDGINVVGGSFPTHIWADFMARALATAPAVAFPAPDPSQTPAASYIPSPGSPTPAYPAGGGGTTGGTTWCWSSCGRSGHPGKGH